MTLCAAFPVEQAEKNLDKIITQLKNRGIPVLLTGMRSPPNMGDQYETAFNNIYPKLAEKHDLLFYDFILEGVSGRSSAQPKATAFIQTLKGQR